MLTLTILEWGCEDLDWYCQKLVPRWPWTNYWRDKLWLVCCLGSEPRLVQLQPGGTRDICRALRWSCRAWGRACGLCQTLHCKPWHLPYNRGKITEKPQSGYLKGAAQTALFNTLRTGDADLRFYITTVQDGWTQICVFNTRLFSLHNTLNYAIHRACLRMGLLKDVCRNLTSLWINV